MDPRPLVGVLFCVYATYNHFSERSNSRKDDNRRIADLTDKHNFLADLVNRNKQNMEITEFDRIIIKDLYDK